jgi:hypothetical protein
MAVVATLEKIAVKMNLNNGTDPETGEVQTVSVNLGSLNPQTYDSAKAMAVAEAIAPCLTKTLYSVQEVRTNSLTNQA